MLRLRLRRDVAPAVIYVELWGFLFRARRGEIHFHFDRMDGAVGDRRRVGQAVFVADQLGDLAIGFLERKPSCSFPPASILLRKTS